MIEDEKNKTQRKISHEADKILKYLTFSIKNCQKNYF